MKQTNLKITFHLILLLILTSLTLLTLGSYLGMLNWIFDLFSHFILQYLILTIITLLLCVLLKKYKSALVFSPLFLILSFEVFSIYFGGNINTELNNATKVSCINILSSNTNFSEVESYIINEDPDILVLLEMNSLWESKLNECLAGYPEKLVLNRNDNFGIALYSKLKLNGISEEHLANSKMPSIRADFTINNIETTLLATHTFPPMGAEQFNVRNNNLEGIALFRNSVDNEFILIGDLNCSSYSSHFNKLLRNAALVDTRKGFGLLTTWPTWFPLMYTTLDHCLVSDGIVIKSRETGNHVGSDHLPINIEIGYN